MAYTPPIEDYKPFYIQTESDTAALDTAEQWGLVSKTNPHPALPQMKEPYRNEWKDEDGDEEYVTDTHFESFTFKQGFYVKAYGTTVEEAAKTVRSQMNALFEKIRKGEFKVYDAYTGLGWQKVRYVGHEEHSYKARDTWARCIFSVEFKVNDPVTAMTLTNGVITEA
jgi:hypothetical protein